MNATSTSTAGALAEIRFMFFKQKYLELIDARELKPALACLREQLGALKRHPDKLRELSSLLFQPPSGDADDERNGGSAAAAAAAAAAGPADPVGEGRGGEGRGGATWRQTQARQLLLEDMQRYVQPASMMPARRLRNLMQEWRELQSQDSVAALEGPVANISLLRDHRERLPGISCVVQSRLTDHTDEVWDVQFSNSGTKFASASKDSTAIVWDVFPLRGKHGKRKAGANPATENAKATAKDMGKPTALHVLCGHTGPISFLAWSPDDSMLLTCGDEKEDGTVRIWGTDTGAALRTIHKPTSACAWAPGGDMFAVGGADDGVTLWSVDKSQNMLRAWPNVLAAGGMGFTPDGSMLVVASSREVHLLTMARTGGGGGGGGGFDDGQAAAEEDATLEESSTIASLTMSRDGREALLSMACKELHLWDLQSHTLLSTYDGYNQERFEIGSCFGGEFDGLVLSGSGNGNVHVWNKHSAKMITSTQAHTATVNAVSWSPLDTGLFVSASDDHTVHLWGIENGEDVL